MISSYYARRFLNILVSLNPLSTSDLQLTWSVADIFVVHLGTTYLNWIKVL